MVLVIVRIVQLALGKLGPRYGAIITAAAGGYVLDPAEAAR
ncbi:hypothetical protein [Streptomyces rhizoryzae]|nr:hypothetical protein [Streptomyces rhizoryzae]